MKVSIVQSDIFWEASSKNREMFDQKLSTLDNDVDLIVLPEMFTTGFSMSPEKIAEGINGPTTQWLLRIAKYKNSAVAGSVAIEDNGRYYNRIILALPNGITHTYSKRHLFRMAGEHQSYDYGKERVVVEWKGFRLLLLICYDLRFPVWSRNRNDYDAILLVANFPTKRIHAWNSLLIARAIENQCFVIACNRIGKDESGVDHCGDSQILDPLGGVIVKAKSNQNQVITTILSINDLQRIREDFPFAPDADQFTLNL